MSKFAEYARFIMHDLEGGDALVEDAGGLTRYGISQRAFPTLNIEMLTEAEALALYRTEYWDRICGDYLPLGTSLLIFDAAINQGQPTAVIFAQRILKVPHDGIMGPVTFGAIRKAKHEEFFLRYATERAAHYASLLHFPRDGKAWLYRLMKVVTRAQWDTVGLLSD